VAGVATAVVVVGIARIVGSGKHDHHQTVERTRGARRDDFSTCV
jgi:hypothetical protein